MKTYTELIQHKTFMDRFNYCKMTGEIGITTFGYERYLNQTFYRSREWQNARQQVILRDEACDLSLIDYPIYGYVRVHHLNPISAEDFERENFAIILDPEYLVCVSLDTHNAIHFGLTFTPKIPLVERQRGDMAPWTVS